jgi:uncharacterized protein (DUF2062 family)
MTQSILLPVVHDNTTHVRTDAETSLPHKNWAYRRIALPIFALLRMGASPRKLAWSIAVGLLIGINPLLGSTTVLCLVTAFVFRLNVAASQLANHIVYPLEIILVIPFIHLGTRVFHTAPLPLSANTILTEARSTPIALIRQIWLWECHALVVWAAFAILATPIIAISLTPLLHRLLKRIERHQYPILPG